MEPYVSPALYGVIGYPIQHSLSPLLHTTAFRTLGIPGILLPWAIEPGQVGLFMQSMRLLGIRGSCVTLPHKQEVLRLADRASERARLTGAANLLHFDGDTLCADNTDVAGFVSPLLEISPAASSTVLLLGAGGAARAAVVGLMEMGITGIHVTSPSGVTAVRLAEAFGLASVPWAERGDVKADIIVNTTPVGMKGRLEGETPYPAAWLAGKTGLVYDIVYTPLRTRLLAEAEAAGWQTQTGLAMFIGQADRQFRTWTDNPLPQAAIDAVTTALYGNA